VKKALTTAEKEKTSLYSELLVTPLSNKANLWGTAVQPDNGPPQTVGLIVKVADPNSSSREVKRLVKEVVDRRH
jgi:hypothetical protein